MTTIYQMYAANHIEIDETEDGQLVCTIPSERDIEKRYTVSCIEHEHSVEVVSCNCLGHKRWGHCKHADICQAFWAKIYKSNQEKLVAKAAQEVKAEAEAAVKEAEKIVTDISIKGSLHGTPQSAGMPSWLAVLPSRQQVLAPTG